MAAFTRLSPLHISLPIRLTTRIHTQWLHPPFSPFSSNSPLPSHFSSARHTTGFILSHLAPFPPPSYVLHFFFASHFHCISRFSLSLPLHLLFVLISNTVTPSLCFLYILKRTKYDRGAIVSKGWVGLQYTRLLQEEATWVFFCSLPRESVCLCVGLPIIMIVWEDCFGMLAVVSVCKCSPNMKGLDYE